MLVESAALQLNLPAHRNPVAAQETELPNDGTRRRALAHDWRDRLRVNPDKDYPKGVLIEGSCRVSLDGADPPKVRGMGAPTGPELIQNEEGSRDLARQIVLLRANVAALWEVVGAMLSSTPP